MPLLASSLWRAAKAKHQAQRRGHITVTIEKAITGETFNIGIHRAALVCGLLNSIIDRGEAPIEPRLVLGTQTLWWNSRLSDYNIQDGARIQLYLRPPKLRISIYSAIPVPAEDPQDPLGPCISFWLQAEASDTIDNIKHEIQDLSGIAHDRLCLSFNGEALWDGGQTLLDYNIGTGAQLTLVVVGRPRWHACALRG